MFQKKSGMRLSGCWEKDKLNGQGTEELEDGTVYKGSFKNGKKHGYGKISWRDGAWYEGEFEMNVF